MRTRGHVQHPVCRSRVGCETGVGRAVRRATMACSMLCVPGARSASRVACRSLEMLLDSAMMLLLNAGVAPTQPALRAQATANFVEPAGLVQTPIWNNPQQAALLMGPFPILATMMREQLQQQAMNYVNGAQQLLDLSMSDDDAAMSDISDIPPLDEQSIGTTAIVGATAAAVALLQLRGAAPNHG